MKKKVEVAILGAGTAGLTALKQVRRYTEDFVIINQPPYGTTCARVGCMPSKALLQVAKDYHRRRFLAKAGVRGTDQLQVDIPSVMCHVRRLRDRFTAGVLRTTEELGERNIPGQARFIGPNTLKVDGYEIVAERIIIATGSHPIVPPSWQGFHDRILTSDTIFEQEDLPRRIGVVGLGAVGIELAQALAWLGLEVTGIGQNPLIGGITDPVVNRAAIAIMQSDYPLYLGQSAQLSEAEEGVRISAADHSLVVDKVLAALGRRPNVDDLGLEALGVAFDPHGIPRFDPETLRIGELPIYIAGDANGLRPLMHEAADEGRIAAYHGLTPDAPCLARRAPLAIVFSEPNIARVGLAFKGLQGTALVIGEVDFASQGRALMAGRNQGQLRLYVKPDNGRLVGAELVAPEGEHLAHLLAFLIQKGVTVHEALQMPFYHPVIEEGLRSALQDARKKLAADYTVPDLPLCGEAPAWPLG